ncbi:hypothetical protein [Bernardetia sp.]|uniref:hypothetical protein n=1 Tax=Bernardetia sp. TaxID=1937974 RepID=UPI0025BB516F|nr:hypothetical protein [Bernardetia sp.]
MLLLNDDVLIQFVEGKLSEEETDKVEKSLLSDRKKKYMFIQLRALHKEGLLQEYLKSEEEEIDFDDEEEELISEEKLSDFIKGKLSFIERQKIEKILSENSEENYEFIKLRGLYEEGELENYLVYQKEMLDKIVEEIIQSSDFKDMIQKAMQSDEYQQALRETEELQQTVFLKKNIFWVVLGFLLVMLSFSLPQCTT